MKRTTQSGAIPPGLDFGMGPRFGRRHLTDLADTLRRLSPAPREFATPTMCETGFTLIIGRDQSDSLWERPR